eukprot:SAG31_NODE_2477_length_5637_cov_10.057241_2_plen_250_part_00
MAGKGHALSVSERLFNESEMLKLRSATTDLPIVRKIVSLIKRIHKIHDAGVNSGNLIDCEILKANVAELQASVNEMICMPATQAYSTALKQMIPTERLRMLELLPTADAKVYLFFVANVMDKLLGTYVGSTVQTSDKREQQHRHDLLNGIHHSYEMQKVVHSSRELLGEIRFEDPAKNGNNKYAVLKEVTRKENKQSRAADFLHDHRYATILDDRNMHAILIQLTSSVTELKLISKVITLHGTVDLRNK